MSESNKTRRSTRQSVHRNYEESPVESPRPRRKSTAANSAESSLAKTPKGTRSNRNTEYLNISDDSPAAAAKTPKSNRRMSTRAKTPSTKAVEAIVTENSPRIEKIDKSANSRRRTITENTHTTPSKTPRKSKTEKIVDQILNSSNGSNEENIDVNVRKPTTLFDDNEDVDGKEMISFKTPKKQNSMAALAQLTPKTPHHNKGTPRRSDVSKTPTSRPSAAHEMAKTPRHVRVQIKQSENELQCENIKLLIFMPHFRAGKVQTSWIWWRFLFGQFRRL